MTLQNLNGNMKLKDAWPIIQANDDDLQSQITNKADDSALTTHVADSVKHITSAERTSWNAKETTAGSQAKMDVVQSNLTAHVGTGGNAHANVVADGASGFMTGADKTKLDGIQSGAEVNQNAFSTVSVSGQSDIVADLKSATLTLTGGTGISITTDATTDKVTITATGTATPGAHASSHITGGADVIPDAMANGNAGLLSGADKAKLDGIQAGATNYVHPSTHPATMIVEDSTHRFATDTEKSTWNGYSNEIGILSNLTTADKSDVVSAINEVQNEINSISLTATSVSIADTTNHFTSTNVEGALDELFTFANNGKTSIANVVGSPTLTSDTFTTISNNIQTQKTNLATNLTNKGQSSSGTETLKSLVDKVANVNTSNIKSIQRGQIGMSTSASVNATLSTVDPTKSVPLITSSNSTETLPMGICVRGTIGSPTTLSLNRVGTQSGVTVSWQVIEFQNVKSIQGGSTSLTSTGATATSIITAVDLNKSFLIASFSTDNNATTASGALYLMYELTNSTTITFTHVTSRGNKTIQWYVVEFN